MPTGCDDGGATSAGEAETMQAMAVRSLMATDVRGMGFHFLSQFEPHGLPFLCESQRRRKDNPCETK
jgi:hypothetical protein